MKSDKKNFTAFHIVQQNDGLSGLYLLTRQSKSVYETNVESGVESKLY